MSGRRGAILSAGTSRYACAHLVLRHLHLLVLLLFVEYWLERWLRVYAAGQSARAAALVTLAHALAALEEGDDDDPEWPGRSNGHGG